MYVGVVNSAMPKQKMEKPPCNSKCKAGMPPAHHAFSYRTSRSSASQMKNRDAQGAARDAKARRMMPERRAAQKLHGVHACAFRRRDREGGACCRRAASKLPPGGSSHRVTANEDPDHNSAASSAAAAGKRAAKEARWTVMTSSCAQHQ
jgi:hypothetical protein